MKSLHLHRGPMTVGGTSVFILFLAFAPTVGAHEVETNRLSLILRDRNHVSLTFFINYPAALHEALAPALPFGEFVVMYSSMSPGDFKTAVDRAHAQLQAGTRLALPSGPLSVGGWTWPSAERAQRLLQEVAMAAIVAPSDHAHGPPLEVRAEAVAREAVSLLDLRLPEELHDVVVVFYRPAQVLAPGNGRPTRIRF